MPLGGIAGGLASRSIWEAGKQGLSAAAHWRFAQVFGPDATRGALHLVVGALVPPQVRDEAGNQLRFIFTKPGHKDKGFSTSLAVPGCEVRAAKYLAETVAVDAGRSSILTADVEIREKRDLSFVSFGMLSNEKTIQLLENSANQFVLYDYSRFISKVSGRTLVTLAEVKTDYGLILKIHPSNLPDKTWICCGGFGEWGTSGSAWYLARHWKTIRSKVRRRAFAAIVRVREGCDESAEPIFIVDTPEEIDRHTR
jgi:hypothetical protein